MPQTRPVQVQFNDEMTFTALSGMSILHIAKANNIDISHYCGGVCSCGTCRVEIKSGMNSLSRMSAREELVLGHSLSQNQHRLACQAKVIGAETVTVKVPSIF